LTPSERIAKCFRDVLDAISLIETWVEASGGTGQAICHDIKTRSAIERQLLVISEGSNPADPTAARRLAPGVDWAGIRGIGNFVRHKYDDLDASILVDVVRNRLIGLRDVCVRAVDTLEGE
jgi:uncharacterized protein with HEPN domain